MVLATLFIISHGYHLILSKRLRSRDITWLTKVRLVKAMIFLQGLELQPGGPR